MFSALLILNNRLLFRYFSSIEIKFVFFYLRPLFWIKLNTRKKKKFWYLFFLFILIVCREFELKEFGVDIDSILRICGIAFGNTVKIFFCGCSTFFWKKSAIGDSRPRSPRIVAGCISWDTLHAKSSLPPKPRKWHLAGFRSRYSRHLINELKSGGCRKNSY